MGMQRRLRSTGNRNDPMTAFESILDLPLLSQRGGTGVSRDRSRAPGQAGSGLPCGIADEAAFLVNGDSYFSTLAKALPKAKRSIWIIGWDFNPDIRLEPVQSSQTLGDLLHGLVDANPELEINILVWALGPLYSGKSLRLFRRRQFPRNPRIRLHFHMHPDIRGSHHQKIVCIDDHIAFVGGIDLTAKRWDNWWHRSRDRLRRDPKGEAYDPLHDVQAMVTGEAAHLVGDVARHRWLSATGERKECLPAASVPAPRPASAPAMKQVPVTVALTDGSVKRYDGMTVTRDVIHGAGRHLYIETQYLASFSLAESLAERLQEPDGPEIVIICTRSSHGFLEKMLMANNRDRIIRRLKQADRHDRFRIYYPVVPDPKAGKTGEKEVLVHSKLLIADEAMLRIGSSNINNRSECMDTECDILFTATGDHHGEAIGALRDSLVGEHLGVDGMRIRELLTENRSLIRTIESLNVGLRGLREFPVDVAGSTAPLPGTELLDPRCGIPPRPAVNPGE